MAESFVLVHAPGLGPRSWAPVADELAGAGHGVTVPSLIGVTDAGPPYTRRLVELARAQIPDSAGNRVVLVLHSGAGVFAPHLAQAITPRGAAVVFADAALPRTDGPATVVDSAFLPFVQNLASDGMVPPWPQWWPDDVMSGQFPDEVTRRSVTREAHAMPLAFFEEVLPPVPGSWRSCHPAYLRFSEGYQGPAREAASRGWPVREVPGEHLYMLVRPPDVAAAIIGLAAETGTAT